MKIVTSSTELADGCAFVPTMGALHAGHASLFKIAREKSDFVVASIFVNPLQFEDQEEAMKYPRTPERDIELAENSGVTHLWLPTYEEIYPTGFAKRSAGALGDFYEGASRSGHFDGVVTVVARLFELVRPKIAIFGEKDFQQLFLIRQMVNQLGLPIEIISAPTIREKNGLAISSRNNRLDKSGKKISEIIYKALTQPTIEQMKNEISTEPGFKLDYLEIIDEATFGKANPDTQNKRVIIAGWVNDLRLIDNMPMGIRK